MSHRKNNPRPGQQASKRGNPHAHRQQRQPQARQDYQHPQSQQHAGHLPPPAPYQQQQPQQPFLQQQVQQPPMPHPQAYAMNHMHSQPLPYSAPLSQPAPDLAQGLNAQYIDMIKETLATGQASDEERAQIYEILMKLGATQAQTQTPPGNQVPQSMNESEPLHHFQPQHQQLPVVDIQQGWPSQLQSQIQSNFNQQVFEPMAVPSRVHTESNAPPPTFRLSHDPRLNGSGDHAMSQSNNPQQKLSQKNFPEPVLPQSQPSRKRSRSPPDASTAAPMTVKKPMDISASALSHDGKAGGKATMGRRTTEVGRKLSPKEIENAIQEATASTTRKWIAFPNARFGNYIIQSVEID
ncbi:hypothetical protein DFJ77DRAFT_100631 [Powellomyces hirtus]|nr:hypothetical protein DFJ77DRAFT_100631 [Powellomyces hirtus]